MSTNHNRIKVADLETNQPNKILKTNLNGELEFSDVSTLKTENYNALDCTSEGKALDARQGKVLKDMIENNNVNLASDLETQITTEVTEDNKVVSRSKLFNWWQWIKSQTQTISGAWNFTNKITLASSTKDTPSLIIPNGTLTTTPQNGAIERDENGQLWETHEGIRSKLLVGNAGIELKGEFSNNSEALAAHLKAGDYYSKPIQSYSDIGLIAVTKNPPGNLTLVFPNLNAAAATLGINNINSIDDWNTFFTSKGSANFTKVLLTQSFIRFLADDSREIKVINLSNIQATGVYLNDLFSVTDIDLSNNKLTGFDIEKWPLLENLILTNNLITTFNPQFLNDTMHKLHLGNNKIVNFNPTRLPSQINTLNLENNPITTTGWNTNVNWINSLKTKEGTLYAGNTTGSIDGTNTESMLKDLGWTITKTPYPFL